MNIARLLSDAARVRPAHPALIFEGREYSYAELDRLTARFANVLKTLGVGPDGVVAIFLESGPELVIAYLGTLKAGAVPNVVNGFLKADEVRVIVADSQAQVFLTDPDRWAMLEPVREGLGTQSVLLAGAHAHGTGTSALAPLLDAAEDSFEVVDRDPGDLASLLYTSGTTGLSKGVMLTQRNIADNAERFRE
ncbi:MAG TPA: AMP-binding protein, partial [Isosphaeraceae bacterium]|nr:AMP-binding protein [Isosphaeraceae bacterium]